MMPLGVLGSARVAAAGLTCTYQTSAIDTVDRSVYTFSAVGIGAASATRRVVVAVATRGVSGAPTITIGGVSATNEVTLNVDGGQQAITIASAVVPTGTTANVVVTLTATIARCGVGVWTLTSGSPTGQTGSNSTLAGATMNVTTQAGDVVIAASSVRMDLTPKTQTWTGITERYDGLVENVHCHAGGDTVATGTTTTITQTLDSAATVNAAVAAVYR